MAELREVVRVSETLTEGQRAIAFFWDDGPRTFTPAGHWIEIAIRLVRTYELGGPQTARVFALLGVTGAEAAIAFFEAKYYWWSIRPITAIWRLCDGGARLCTEAELAANPSRAAYRERWHALIPTPPFPSYPGGHSTFSGACGKVLTYFFPQAGNTLNQLAEEAALSRLYGGIHFREDNDAGLALGRAVADYAIRWAEADGGP
jgi:membrane-associated phospholipid phosphatase